MRGQRGHVDVERLRVERELADRLRGVGGTARRARSRRADRGDVLHGADFVVAVHDADEDGVGGEGGGELVEIDEALAVDREAGDPVAILCQASTRIEDGLVLRRRRDDVSAFVQPGYPLDRQIVRFGRARREDDFLRRDVQRLGDGAARLVDGVAGLRAERVAGAGGVAENFGEVGTHRLEHAVIDGRRGVAIEIDRQLHTGASAGGRMPCARPDPYSTTASFRRGKKPPIWHA